MHSYTFSRFFPILLVSMVLLLQQPQYSAGVLIDNSVDTIAIDQLTFSKEEYVTVQLADQASASLTQLENGVKSTCNYPSGVSRACLAPPCDNLRQACSTVRIYLGPYPAVLPEIVKFRDRQIYPVLAMTTRGCCIGGYWENGDYLTALVTPDKIVDGLKAMDRWTKLADQKQLFGCTVTDCFGVIKVHANEVEGSSLFVCRFAKDGSVVGAAPDSCKPVLVTQGDQIRVLGVVGENCNCLEQHMEGGPDFSVHLKGSALGPQRLFDALQHTLADPPLSLLIGSGAGSEANPRTAVIGTAKFRASPILQGGWREIVTVRLDVYESANYNIVASSALYVNRQNTSRPTDYAAPSEQQQSLYVNAIKGALKNSLEKLCGVPIPEKRDLAGSTVDCVGAKSP